VRIAVTAIFKSLRIHGFMKHRLLKERLERKS